jgi:hypothetical protein
MPHRRAKGDHGRAANVFSEKTENPADFLR